MELKENESIEDLQINNLKIIQNKKWFCFGMDSILISDFAKNIKKDTTVIDLGAGTGIIAILLSAKTEAKKIICIEKQPEMVDIIKRNIELNNLQTKIEIKNTDIIDLKIKEEEKVDVIVTNPPYKKSKTGMPSTNKQKYISKFETTATLENFTQIAAKLLKDKGKLFMVHRPDRITDIIETLRKNKLEPKRLRLVYSHNNTEENAKLVLIEAVKNAKPFLKVVSPLIVYNQDNTYTSEIHQIYSNQLF